MKLALAAKLTIDPKRLLSSRWVHDTAHAFATSVRKAKDAAAELAGRKRPARMFRGIA